MENKTLANNTSWSPSRWRRIVTVGLMATGLVLLIVGGGKALSQMSDMKMVEGKRKVLPGQASGLVSAVNAPSAAN